jgi:hypothetical protein
MTQGIRRATMIRIRPQIIDDAKKKAIDLKVSYSELVEKALMEFLSKN